MDRGFSAIAVAVVFAAIPLMCVDTNAQSASARSAKTWTAPLTADGQPDLQGFWTNDTYTPLERPADLAGKEFFTPEEAAAFVKKNVERLLGQSRTEVHYDDSIWQGENYSKETNRRTSLIIDPRDGRLPPLTPDAQKRQKTQFAVQRAASSASAQHRSLAERCISWGNVGPPMMPPTYNANLQIMQTRDLVIIRHEMVHDVRIVYMDGRPHPAPNVRYMAGDARGQWDGQTLVVDTTNFTDRTNFRGSPQNTRQDIFATSTLHVVERFTRDGPKTIRYEFTVEDPNTWTRPWSGEMPIRAFEGPIYEYACHEGNYGLPNILRAARVQEAKGIDAPVVTGR